MHCRSPFGSLPHSIFLLSLILLPAVEKSCTLAQESYGEMMLGGGDVRVGGGGGGGGGTGMRAGGGPMHFKLGFLGPWKNSFEDISALTSASAISMAISHVEADPIMGRRFNFSVVTYDSGCNSKISTGNAVNLLIRDKVDAFIGPACSIACRPVAELASFWNKPMVSWVATDPDFGDKTIYSTLGRSLGPFTKMGNFMLEIFKQYNWTRAVVISSTYLLWGDASRAIRKVFLEANISIPMFSEYDDNPTDAYFIRTLQKTKEEGRIVVVIAPKYERRRIILAAHDLGMTSGDYVFYTMDLLPDDLLYSAGQIWVGNDGRDAAARIAFEAVFHVTLAALENTEVDEFRAEVARRMRQPPWNAYSKNVNMLKFVNGDKYSPFLFDAVMLYAIALNLTVAKGMDVRSGQDVVANMNRLSFKGKSGLVNMDAFGDRDPSYWITDMAANGTFIRVAELSFLANGTRMFHSSIVPPRWPGGKVGHQYAPPDVPTCGFRGEFCIAGQRRYALLNAEDFLYLGYKSPTEDQSRAYKPYPQKPSFDVADWIIALTVLASLAVLSIIGGVLAVMYKQIILSKNLLSQSWRVKWEDVEVLKSGKGLSGSTPSAGVSEYSASGAKRNPAPGDVKVKVAAKTEASKVKESSTKLKELLNGSQNGSHPSTTSLSNARSLASIGTGAGQLFAEVGLYRGVAVAIKHVKKEHVQLTKQVLMEFNDIKDLVNENVNVFVGACIDPPNICILWKYCSKGSLTDVLENDNYKLDNTFKLSFMTDIIKGMGYIHQTTLGSHGNLKSSNCIVDSRWSLKITDYGLPSFLAGQEQQTSEVDVYKRKFWTAPELLRENFPPVLGTQKGDVYSFSIVCYEIVMRSEPYNLDNFNPRDVINRVRNGESIPFRPVLPDSVDLGKAAIDLVKSCWDENPDLRPTFKQIRRAVIKLAGGNINIMDSVMAMMEKYAQNLEDVVEERSQQLLEEKQKTDRLLYRLLPPVVAEKLKTGNFIQPEQYDQASIYFSDIVGFTTIASDSSPMQIVEFLNDLYSCFDDIIAKHDVYKVETIGDAYLVVSGVPQRNGNRHVAEIANVSLDLLSAVTSFKIRHRPNQQLQLRIGLHSGSVVAGVVGNVMPRYCLFGDTVTMAQCMESSGKPLHVHISKATYEHLNTYTSGVYQMTKRGETNIKGKGFQTTFWLHGKKGFDKPLPAFDKNESVRDEEVRRPNKSDSKEGGLAAEQEVKHDQTPEGGNPSTDGASVSCMPKVVN